MLISIGIQLILVILIMTGIQLPILISMGNQILILISMIIKRVVLKEKIFNNIWAYVNGDSHSNGYVKEDSR